MERIVTLEEFPLVDFVNLVNEIFADYTIPINWDVLNFRLDARENSLSFALSYVFLEGERPVGFIVTGVRKNRGRIDAMGVIKEKRGTGLAQRILQHALENLKWHGVERVLLEVASEDARAVRFYEKNGFRELRRLYTLAIRPEDFADQARARFFKTEAKWIHRAAIEAEMNVPRKPNWQREPLTLLLSNGRYRMERVVMEGEEGYVVWGETPDSAFIVDLSPIKDSDLFQPMLAAAVERIFKITGKPVITISSVPEDDPLYDNALRVGFKQIFEQKEMCFRLPS